MLAMNISGKSSRPPFLAWDFETVIGAQFMYISRFPILLNHVQASAYFPLGTVGGIWKL